MARLLLIQTEWFEHLGVLWLLACARAAGHDARLIVGRHPKKLAARAVAQKPDVVGFSAATGGHRAALAVANQLRPVFSGRIVMGGPHPTFFPEVIAEPSLDAVCRGEGERAIVDFLDRIDRGGDVGGTPGWWVKEGGEVRRNEVADLVADLDSVPPPARDLLEAADPWFRRDSMQRVMAGRGCPYHCTYCFNQSLRELTAGKGPYVRQRSVDHVMAELMGIKRRGKRTINFVDDTFGLRRDWALALLDRYRVEVRLPFIVNLRPEQADHQLCRALAAAGCHCAQMGVESADAGMRRKLLGRDTPDEVLAAGARNIRDAGIRLLTYNMVGLPGETLAGAAATLAWNGALEVDYPRVSIFQPYPRTRLGDSALAGLPACPAGDGTGGVDPAAAVEKMDESYFRRSPLAGDEARRIENLHKLFSPYVRHPRLRPLIRALCRLPANPLFDAAFLASMGWQYRGATNRSLAETAALGLRNLRGYFG